MRGMVDYCAMVVITKKSSAAFLENSQIVRFYRLFRKELQLLSPYYFRVIFRQGFQVEGYCGLRDLRKGRYVCEKIWVF